MLWSKQLKEKANKVLSYGLYKLNYTLNAHSSRTDTHGYSVIVASGHKVGSTWLFKLLRDLYIFNQVKIPVEYQSHNSKLLSLNTTTFIQYLNKLHSSCLFKTHEPPPSCEIGSHIKTISVFRDPRDVVISNIFYLANLSLKYGGWTILNDMSIKERIIYYLDKAVFDLELFEKWYNYPPAYKVEYEQMLSDIKGVMNDVIAFLDMKVDPAAINKSIERNTFQRLSGGRKIGNQNKQSFYRKGVSGDWKEYFDKDLLDYFKTVHNGRWNKLLVDLGYEESLDWSLYEPETDNQGTNVLAT